MSPLMWSIDKVETNARYMWNLNDEYDNYAFKKEVWLTCALRVHFENLYIISFVSITTHAQVPMPLR